MAQTSVPDVTGLAPDLAHVLERITDGFFALDSAWRIVYMNSEGRNLLRAGTADVIGRGWLDVFPRARGTAFEREYKRAMREQAPVQFVEFSSTSHLWLEVKAYPSPDGISVYFRDVSARLKAERELQTRSAQLQAMIAFGRFALSGATPEQLLNDAIEMLTVYLEVPIAEIHLYDAHEETFTLAHETGWGDSAEERRHVPVHSQAGLALKGQPVVAADARIDPRFTHRTGFAKAGVRAALVVPIGAAEEPAGVLAAYSTQPRVFTTNDVRFAESIATILGEAMRTNEQKRRVAEVLESITDAFASFDRDLRITYVNRRMAMFYGFPRDYYTGRSLTEFLPGGEDDPNLDVYRRALEDRMPASYETQLPDSGKWFEARIYPSIDGLSLYLRDVTKRKTGELQLQQLNAQLEHRVRERTMQLEQANKELESFAYSVSHDLRAPLRAIDGFSLALEEDYREHLDDGAMQYLGRVRAAARRMSDLIDALLQLARVARAPIARVPVDMRALAESVVSDLRASEPEREVLVEVEAVPPAMGEPLLLRALLENLLGNAWKFTRRAEHARIVFGCEDGEYVVRDNGAGFDMAYANKLFGAFQRLHSAGEYEGTGIGLATVARIVHRHGGEVRAEGAVDAGAAFYFTIAPEEPVEG